MTPAELEAYTASAAEGQRGREREEAAKARLHKWEQVTKSGDRRMAVPGGWIYLIPAGDGNSAVFVPEPR